MHIHIESWLAQSRKQSTSTKLLFRSTMSTRQCGIQSYVGEVHCLALEEGNKHDHFAICVKRDEIIDHVPRELSGEVSIFWGMEDDHHVKSLEEENKKTDWRCRVGTAL